MTLRRLAGESWKRPHLASEPELIGLAGGDVLHDDLAQHLAGAAVEIVTMEIDVLEALRVTSDRVAVSLSDR